MADPLYKRIFRQEHFLWLLPLFFIGHGIAENYGLVPPGDAALLFLQYLLLGAVLFGISLFLFRNRSKAAVYSLFLLCWFYFFGAVHDGLKAWLPGSFLARYSFLLPFFFLLCIVLFVVIRKSGRSFDRLFLYVHSLLLVWILADVARILAQHTDLRSLRKEGIRIQCPRCSRPDIYLIVSDGYAGSLELKDLFGFDNTAFEQQLQQRGFTVLKDTRCNYNSTEFSTASFLNMNYLPLRSGKLDNRQDVAFAYDLIENNRFTEILSSAGYRVYNHSIFDLKNEPAKTKQAFYARNIRLISSASFWERIKTDIFFNLVGQQQLHADRNHILYFNRNNNRLLDSLTRKIAGEKTADPKFVYTHLVMPHYPYYFDSSGKEFSADELSAATYPDKSRYLGYLKFSNRVFLELIDAIRSGSPEPPVILFISDHGFREMTQPVKPEYYFMNFAAVSVPGSPCTGFRDGMTSVNLLRSLLNCRFGQRLPLLSDSLIYLKP